MSSAPYDLSISAARTGALFASLLQRSDEPSARQIRQAIATAIGAHGVRGCAAHVAQAFGRSLPAGAAGIAPHAGPTNSRSCSAGREGFAVWLPIAL